MIPSGRKTRLYAPDPNAPGHVCDALDCDLPGEYRAPKSRSALNEFRWFCLEHVREYNASWDYYRGMSPGEIEAQLRSDTSWQRPSWPLGHLGQKFRIDQAIEDELHAFTSRSKAGAAQPATLPAELREALGILGLVWPVSMEVLKSRYKELAKRHHPDANGGNKASEEILKSINLAYATLRAKLAVQLAPSPHPAAE
jgi:hypothetical protein